jgi:PAS domain S-box-containing protein
MKAQAKKLLIIEGKQDEWSLKEQNFGPFSSVFASSLSDARDKIRESTFHIVVSDYVLQDGLCLELLPDLGGIPLIVMTNEGDEEIIPVALKAGAFDYIIKDIRHNFIKLLPLTIYKSFDQKIQSEELKKYRTQLENIVEERTNDLIDMYGKLQESETNFRNIFSSTNDGIILMDYEFRFIEVNDAVIKQFGVTREFLASQNLLDYLVPEYRTMVLNKMEMLAKGYPSGVMECELISPSNGAVIPYEISSVPIVFNRKNVILHLMRNIQERRNHARKLFETIIQTEEDERARIARDLHDEIGPLISALKIYTTTFLESSIPEKKEMLASQIGSIVRDVLDSIKIISNDMSPHVLVNFGLLAAVQNFIEIFAKNIDIVCSSNFGNARFPSTVESLIYRIFKELINNTIKHAQASEITINLDYINDAIICEYQDNGIGFDWKKQVQSPSKGMGINNIITRIKSLGGDFAMYSEPSKGFRINFFLKTGLKDDANKEEIQGYYR